MGDADWFTQILTALKLAQREIDAVTLERDNALKRVEELERALAEQDDSDPEMIEGRDYMLVDRLPSNWWLPGPGR